MRRVLCALSVAVGLVFVVVGASPASAATPAPAWTIHSLALPTHFSAADNAKCPSSLNAQFPACDGYQVTATNAGAKPTSGAITIADTLPAGLQAQGIRFLLVKQPLTESQPPVLQPGSDCELATATCKYASAVAPDQALEMIVYLTVEPSAPEALPNKATVKGGKAPEAGTETENQLAPTPPPFGPISLTNLIAAVDGTAETRAGAHPYELSTRIDLASAMKTGPEGSFAPNGVEDPRDVLVDLPLGFLGTALATPPCQFSELARGVSAGVGGCPLDTIVGHLFTEPSGGDSTEGPIYNMVPEPGLPAEFGFVDVLGGTHVLYASVVPTPEGYVLRTTAPEIPQVELTDIVTNFYGNPEASNGGAAEGQEEVPFFTNPSNCNGKPLITAVHLDSWQHPGTYNPDGSPNLADPNWTTQTSASPPVTGCNQLHFKATIEATPETNRADSPTGLDVNLTVPQTEGVETLATPPLRKAVVTLPAGMTVNPSSANGLQGCSLAQVGISATGVPNAATPACPDAAKIGTVELLTPDVEGDPKFAGALQGQIYVARQSENPFGTLLAIYIVVDDPYTGVIVKLPGEVKADPATGQLTTVVDQSPQFPFSELRTHFFGGTKAALRTPAVCGIYKVTSNLTPWSAPESGPAATPSSSFKITQAPGGGACPETAAEEPHAPSFSAGTLTPTAGLFSPFVLRLKREDGSQELKGLSVTLPEGLIGKLAGIAECPDSALATAAAKTGTAELASPSCPASSEVGTVTVGAGAGLTPYYTKGKAYLAGPYKGAPLSLAIVTPAVAGPYDLGDVVVRTALRVNPETAQISAVSDPLPTILDGIPLDVRSIALNMSRNQFTLNPTSCEKMAVSGEALSVLDQVAPLTNPFQVGGCRALAFKPKLSLTLKGATNRTAHPRLIATLKAKPGEANIARAQVKLPKAAFLDQGHIGTICTRPDFASHTCPAASVYGKAVAKTPLLDAPLSGDVYLRANPAHKLPDLVADLNGQIEVALAGKTDSVKGALRNTFEAVPDAPVSSFRLELFGGRRGLIELSSGFCASPRASVKLLGQNGKVDNYNPLIGNSCPKKGSKGHKHHKRVRHERNKNHRANQGSVRP